MRKFRYIFIIQLLFINTLNAQEPSLAILDAVYSNNVQKFSIGTYSFYCSAYGVLSLEELMKRSKENSICKNTIEFFYAQNPHLKYKIESILKLQSKYHIEFRESQCVVYANGEKTISEILLENGLALIKPNFNDEEFRFSMYKYEKRAKLHKFGMWKDDISKSCVTEIYQK